MASYFRLNGYQAETNVRLEGKSGAVHEIDVLAKRVDGITAFTVAVECKAWASPIEKDVVSKLSMIIADLGLNKGIIVSLDGWRTGAEKSALQEGIELWGPEELSQRLGQVALAELGSGTTNRYEILGLSSPRMSEGDLAVLLGRQSRGLMGLARETAIWAGTVWLPFHLIELHHASVVKEFLRKPTVKVTPVWGLYSALDDAYFATYNQEPSYTTMECEHVVPAKTSPKSLINTLVTTVKKSHEVTTDAALRRYREKLNALGLPDNLENLSTEKVLVIHYPFYVGLLRRHGNDRMVAIDSTSGQTVETVSQTLTKTLSYVCQALHIS